MLRYSLYNVCLVGKGNIPSSLENPLLLFSRTVYDIHVHSRRKVLREHTLQYELEPRCERDVLAEKLTFLSINRSLSEPAAAADCGGYIICIVRLPFCVRELTFIGCG